MIPSAYLIGRIGSCLPALLLAGVLVAPPALAQAPVPAPPPLLAPPTWTPRLQARWRAGQILYGVGSGVRLVGSGLILSGIVVGAVRGTDAPVTTGLVYAGSSTTAAGFLLSAAGLGCLHSALAEAGADPGRGLFAAGTTLGVIGILGVGTGYFFNATQYVHNSNTIAFSAAVSGSVLAAIGGVLYLVDAGHLGRARTLLGRF